MKTYVDFSNIENIECPVCRHFVYQERFQIKTWKIVQCKQCDFVYVNPRLHKQELFKIYTSNYFDNTEFGYYHYTENKDLRKKNFTKWITDSFPFIQKDISIKALDVGCAAGYCLEVFEQNNWTAYGIELDKKIAATLRKKGYTIFDTPLIKLTTQEKFDVISLFDVIEHLTDLNLNMSTLHSLLKDNGIIVLVTPNYNSWQRKMFSKRWFQFKPIEHINYFSKKTMIKLAEENGFEVVFIKRSGQFCDINLLENRLKRYGLHKFLVLLRLFTKFLRLNNKFLYVDTASLYVILKKRPAPP